MSYPCGNCNLKFRRNAIYNHIEICKKRKINEKEFTQIKDIYEDKFNVSSEFGENEIEQTEKIFNNVSSEFSENVEKVSNSNFVEKKDNFEFYFEFYELNTDFEKDIFKFLSEKFPK
jgi:hypothetical protein